jgi:hypothetical protein
MRAGVLARECQEGKWPEKGVGLGEKCVPDLAQNWPYREEI